MNEKIVSGLWEQCFSEAPQSIERCTVGHGNFVYIIEYSGMKYVLRCSSERNAYDNTIYWLEQLSSIEIPVPQIIAKGTFGEYEYLILSYFEGRDIGLVYPQLSDTDKKEIAREIVHIQDKAAALKLKDVKPQWSWHSDINDMLDRSKERIAANGYFDVSKVDRLRKLAEQLNEYFTNIRPTAYLDDISTKNLLIHNGRISGIVDIDWIGIGDSLTYVALTNMALLDLQYDTDYVKYILKEMQVNEIQKKAFLFYTLMFCVDFMGERGMRFMDKTVEVNEHIIEKLNGIYDRLWEEWINKYSKNNARQNQLFGV